MRKSSGQILLGQDKGRQGCCVAERVEELVMEGDETEESPCDSTMAATLLFMEPVVLLLAMEITLYAKKPLIN